MSIHKIADVLIHQRRLPYRISKYLQWSYYVKSLTTRAMRHVYETEPIATDADSDFEVVTLSGFSGIPGFLIAVKSLFVNAPIRARVTLISDGSLAIEHIRVLQKHVRGIRCILPTDFNDGQFSDASFIRDVRSRYVLAKKLLDLPLDSLANNLIFLDSDVVVCNPIDDCWFDLSQVAVRYNRDHDHRANDANFYLVDEFAERLGISHPVHDLNSGFVFLRKEVIDLRMAEDFFRFLAERQKLHPLLEQDCMNMLSSRYSSRALPDSFRVGCNPDHARLKTGRDDFVSMHFVSGVRWSDFSYLRLIQRFLRRCRKKA